MSEESRGRSGSVHGGGGRIKPTRPRPPLPSEVNIEGSIISFEEPSAHPPLRSKTSLTERLKPRRPFSTPAEAAGSGSVISSFSMIKSHVDVSSRVDIHIGGIPKVKITTLFRKWFFFVCGFFDEGSGQYSIDEPSVYCIVVVMDNRAPNDIALSAKKKGRRFVFTTLSLFSSLWLPPSS